MDSSVISGLVGGAIAVALVTYLSARVRNARADGSLRYGWGVLLLGVACLAIVGVAIVAFFIDENVWTDRGEFIAVIGLIVGFGLGAVYSFGEYFFVRGNFDDEGIEFYSPWTGSKKEKWDDLRSAKFNGSLSWYVLRFRSGKTIRLSSLLSGHGGVLAKLQELGYQLDE